MQAIPLTFTQCKQIAQLTDLRDAVDMMRTQPEWLLAMGGIEDLSTIQAVNQGGCASGAFMPAAEYYTAKKIMGEHGDDVLDYMQDIFGEIPPIGDQSWGQYCCFIVSTAVELWCSQFGEFLDSVDWD